MKPMCERLFPTYTLPNHRLPAQRERGRDKKLRTLKVSIKGCALVTAEFYALIT